MRSKSLYRFAIDPEPEPDPDDYDEDEEDEEEDGEDEDGDDDDGEKWYVGGTAVRAHQCRLVLDFAAGTSYTSPVS